MKKLFAVLVAAVLVLTALCAALCASLTVSAETTNVALGKSYTISQQFRQSTETWTWDDNAPIAYPDNGGELTDGKFASEETGYGDDAWIGFHGGAPEYKDVLHYSYMRVDLGAVYTLSELKLYVGSKKLGSGITAPTTVEFYVSEDGETYTGLGEITPEDTEESSIVAVTQETTVSARYVEIRMTRDGNWMFVTEFEAYADPAGAGTDDSKGDDNSKTDDDSKTDDNSKTDDDSKTDDNSKTDDDSKTDDGSKTDTPSTPSEATSSGSDKVPTGDMGVLLFAVLGVAAVAGTVIAVRKRA